MTTRSHPPPSETTFRALVDPKSGVLQADALLPPPRSASFTVFAQRPDARLDVAQLENQAARFFAAKLGLTVEKRYGGEVPVTDAARVVLACDDGSAAGTRLVYGRPAQADDHAAAEEAERRQGTFGMALLAQRCPTVWLVVREGEDDRVALTIAAVFASAFLGPILSPEGDKLFGVRSARLELERRSAPYR